MAASKLACNFFPLESIKEFASAEIHSYRWSECSTGHFVISESSSIRIIWIISGWTNNNLDYYCMEENIESFEVFKIFYITIVNVFCCTLRIYIRNVSNINNKTTSQKPEKE